MAIIRNTDSFFSDHFIFCGNNIILEGKNLPSKEILKKCLALNVASDWISDEEYDFSAIELENNCPVPASCTSIPLRTFFWEQKQNPEIVKKASRAKGLINFRKSHRYCSYCGGALKDDLRFVARTCVQCGRIIFPRLEPAVIVLVKNKDKVLLARHKNRNDDIYSCIAGFVEIGETIEQTVSREVKEETGITVKNIKYAGSQAWPYPDQLMLAFYCEYDKGEIKIQEEELLDASWFSLDSLPNIPPPGSVAYNLIHAQF